MSNTTGNTEEQISKLSRNVFGNSSASARLGNTPPESEAIALLREALNTLVERGKRRDNTEGQGERSMEKAVAIFNAWTGSSMDEEDGWRFMICLKQAREIQGNFHRDDCVDLVGYSSLLGELS